MKKRILSVMLLGAITTTMLSAQSVFAASGTKTTTVTYNNQTVIPDPDHPNAPDWVVTIPSAINFTDTVKTQDTDVTLQKVDGSAVTDSTLNVNVTVASTNHFKLKKGTQEIDYSLEYASVIDGTNNNVGTLTSATPKKDGTATLGNTNMNLERGSYTDTLTYTVQKQ